MGKRKKNKKKQKRYNKNQFIGIVCAQCKICGVYNPIFCYDIAYKEDPEIFMKEIYPRLLRQKLWLDKNSAGPDFIEIMQFRELFCYSGICGGGYKMACHSTLDCFNSFQDQIKGVKIIDKRQKRVAAREPVVFEPYATFFISDDEEFKKEIRGILGDGDRDIEQDSGEGSPLSTG